MWLLLPEPKKGAKSNSTFYAQSCWEEWIAALLKVNTSRRVEKSVWRSRRDESVWYVITFLLTF